jgi:hypothetical protein
MIIMNFNPKEFVFEENNLLTALISTKRLSKYAIYKSRPQVSPRQTIFSVNVNNRECASVRSFYHS